MDLTGRSVLVTGGGSGIGAASAAALAARGARVLVVDLDVAKATNVASGIVAAGGEAIGVTYDVTNPTQVEAMVAEAVSRHGGLHHAVHSAGTSGSFAFVADADLDSWRRTVELNLNSVFYCMRSELPHLLEAGGSIVNISSGAGLMGFAGLSAYVASKHAVIGLTRSAALEYARRGVRVNAICPGTVRTPMLEGFVGGNEAALDAMGKQTPMGRLGSPAEIAEAVAWLCSPAASYVTGLVMSVDGGVSAA